MKIPVYAEERGEDECKKGKTFRWLVVDLR